MILLFLQMMRRNRELPFYSSTANSAPKLQGYPLYNVGVHAGVVTTFLIKISNKQNHADFFYFILPVASLLHPGRGFHLSILFPFQLFRGTARGCGASAW